MNRIDRLFAILVLLQRRTRVRAHDLAAHFEISLRTVYRDMAALQQIGVPIVSLPGEGYELTPGFFLPPLIFTPAEAGALVLSAQLLIAQADGMLPIDAERAMTKIVAVLPRATREQVDRMTAMIEFFRPQQRLNLDDSRLSVLQQAIQECHVVWLQYHSYTTNTTTEREVEPHQLIYANGSWYLNGYCRLREGPRSFRLDRIDGLRLQAQTFGLRNSVDATGIQQTVRVRFAAPVVRWVHERQHYAFVAVEAMNDHSVAVMIYRVNRLSELVPWLLSWGAAAEVLAPPELRDVIRQEAQKLLNMLT